ncbi:hypothetical protein ANCCAN_13738 [Ancylostoma caninum]|uniref:Uncharacterized protein n=1 Tax=Ancylostoma caninum TaxID=29170 RepID=A0A368G791_ANCCA|nr:hypothetical protein ANCCAN_13738 [Ancylostoma caninum]
MQNSFSTSFHHSILNLCKSVNSLSASLIAAVSANPTIAMRNVLQRSDIEAAFLGNNIVRTKSCVAVSSSMYTLSMFNSSCFALPSVTITLPDKSHWKTFVDPVTGILSNDAPKVECKQGISFEFSSNNSVVKFFPMSGVYEKIPSSSITVIQHSIIVRALMLYASFQAPSELFKFVQMWGPRQTRNQTNPTEPQNEFALVSKTAAERDIEQNFPKVFNISTRNTAISAHIRVKVNGVNASALIDTGSCITLAAKDLCPALGIFHLDQPKSDSAIGMAGVHVPLAGSKKVELKIGDIILQPTFHFTQGSCVPNMISAYEVILGNDILALLPLMTIDYGGQKVHFGSTVLPLGKFPSLPVNCRDAQHYVRVKQTVNRPANSEAFIMCTTQTEPPGKDLVLVSQCAKLANKDLIVAPALINSQQPVLLMMLSKFINIKQEDWDLFLPCVAFCYNTTTNESTGETPYFLMFGPDEVSEYKAQLISALHLAWSNAAEHARAYKAKMKAQYDKAARPSQIREGDRVFFKNYTNKQGLARKLCFPWIGITAPTSKPRRVHINQIKKIVDYSGPSLTLPTVPQEEEFITALPEEQSLTFAEVNSGFHSHTLPSKIAENMADSFNLDEDSRTLNTSVTPTEGPSQVQSLIAPPDHEQQEDDQHDVHMENNDDAENQAVDLQPPPPPPPNEETIRKSNTDQQVPTPVTSLRRQDPRYCSNICGDSSDDDEELQWYKPRSRESSPESEPTRESPIPYQSITSPEGSTPKNYGTYAAAVGPKAIEAFRENNQCEHLPELRREGKPLPTMPVVELASNEEKNTYVHGLVLDGGVAPVLYRIKCFFGLGVKLESVHAEVPLPDRPDLHTIQLDHFGINIKTGKRGIDITKMMIGDLVWVYSLAVTTKYATSDMEIPLTVGDAVRPRQPNVWRAARFALIYRELVPTLGFVTSMVSKQNAVFKICMQGHRQLITVNRNRLGNPSDFNKIEANSFIVAPFRERQIDYMVFACEWRAGFRELSSYMADIQYFPSPAPTPFNIRNTSKEHQELVKSKLHKFDLFEKGPNEAIRFLAPLYSTACGTIAAAITDTIDTSTHSAIWTSPNLNSFPVLVNFRVPIKKKTGWAVGRPILGAYEADFLQGQIVSIEMTGDFLRVTAKLDTADGVRFRMYILNSRNRRISVGTTLHTLDERANPVLAMLESASLARLFRPDSLGWQSARALLAGDVELKGTECSEKTAITVNVAGSQVQLNEDQVNAVNLFNKKFPILVVDSAYGAGKSLCTAVMAKEAVEKGQTILVAAVQNSALDVIGAKIAQLQSKQIKAVRYVNEILAQDATTSSPFALHTLMENFHITHRHLLTDSLYRKFERFSEGRRQMREFMFTGVQGHVVTSEHKKLMFLEERTSSDVKVLIRYFLKLYKPNIYLCTISASQNLTLKKGNWRIKRNSWKSILLDEASMIPEAALMTLMSRF